MFSVLSYILSQASSPDAKDTFDWIHGRQLLFSEQPLHVLSAPRLEDTPPVSSLFRSAARPSIMIWPGLILYAPCSLFLIDVVCVICFSVSASVIRHAASIELRRTHYFNCCESEKHRGSMGCTSYCCTYAIVSCSLGIPCCSAAQY